MNFSERLLERAAEIELRARDQGIREILDRPIEAARIIDGVTVCRSCAAPIPLERLAAWPTAVRCVACQTQHEQKHRRGR